MEERITYCGIDLHKKYCFIAILAQDGQLRQEIKLPNDEGQIAALFQGIPGSKKVAVEATYNWEWLVDLLEGIEHTKTGSGQIYFLVRFSPFFRLLSRQEKGVFNGQGTSFMRSGYPVSYHPAR